MSLIVAQDGGDDLNHTSTPDSKKMRKGDMDEDTDEENRFVDTLAETNGQYIILIFKANIF